jgi:tetratricopeptide (TPR) repeat protein
MKPRMTLICIGVLACILLSILIFQNILNDRSGKIDQRRGFMPEEFLKRFEKSDRTILENELYSEMDRYSKDPVFWNFLGSVQVSNGNLKDALKSFNISLSFDSNWKTSFNRAQTLLSLGEYAESLRQFQDLHESAPDGFFSNVCAFSASIASLKMNDGSHIPELELPDEWMEYYNYARLIESGKSTPLPPFASEQSPISKVCMDIIRSAGIYEK